MTEQHKCDNCGADGATWPRPCRDICPTDLGDEIREGVEYYCDECDEELFPVEDPR